MPEISILIPVYNAEKYLRECLDSVLNQTFSDFECICMNDGSTDKSIEILNEYAKNDPRIKVHSQENSGVATARNKMMDLSSGKYIAFLDADDKIAKNMFEISLYFIKKHNADIVEFFPSRDDISKSPLASVDSISPHIITDMTEFLSRKKAYGCWINIWNKLYKKECLKGVYFDKNLSYEEDFWFSSVVLSKIKTKVCLPVPLYFYRVNEGSVTVNINFRKYVNSAITRIKNSYDFFILGNKVPENYLSAFKSDLTNDAFRMIVQKNLKKNKNFTEKNELFILAAKIMCEFLEKNMLEPKYLTLPRRICLYFTTKKIYFLARLFSVF